MADATADDDDTLAEAFRLLSRGVADRRSAFHTPTVVTTGADGAPEARTVVLRACDPAARVLTFHTDARAGKVARMRAQPRVSLHVYDPGRRVQVRASGMAALHRDDAWTLAAWRAATHGSRSTYRVVQAPGSIVADPSHVDPLGLDDDAAYANFTLVRVRVETLEWLHLAASGHRRTRFAWRGGALLREHLVP